MLIDTTDRVMSIPSTGPVFQAYSVKIPLSTIVEG